MHAHSALLSDLILGAFAVFGLIVLPALAEIRSRRSSKEPGGDRDDVRQEEDPGEMLAA